MRSFASLRMTRCGPEGLQPRLRQGDRRMDQPLMSFQGQATRRVGRPERCDRIALVLQGGGALGAYQAGVYQALQEVGLEPDWVSGVSIGAINGAIIAGNPPALRLERLRTFWERITHRK